MVSAEINTSCKKHFDVCITLSVPYSMCCIFDIANLYGIAHLVKHHTCGGLGRESCETKLGMKKLKNGMGASAIEFSHLLVLTLSVRFGEAFIVGGVLYLNATQQ